MSLQTAAKKFLKANGFKAMLTMSTCVLAVRSIGIAKRFSSRPTKTAITATLKTSWI